MKNWVFGLFAFAVVGCESDLAESEPIVLSDSLRLTAVVSALESHLSNYPTFTKYPVLVDWGICPEPDGFIAELSRLGCQQYLKETPEARLRYRLQVSSTWQLEEKVLTVYVVCHNYWSR